MRSARNAGNRGVFGDMARMLEHLPHHQDSAVLILLKGHLLVEELLRGYIDRTLSNPSAFDHRQFTFARILMLCRAQTPSAATSWGFDAAKKLNDVRNEIAHELDATELQAKLEAFVSLVEQHATDSVFPPKERGDSRIYMGISDLYNELSRALRGRRRK